MCAENLTGKRLNSYVTKIYFHTDKRELCRYQEYNLHSLWVFYLPVVRESYNLPPIPDQDNTIVRYCQRRVLIVRVMIKDKPAMTVIMLAVCVPNRAQVPLFSH